MDAISVMAKQRLPMSSFLVIFLLILPPLCLAGAQIVGYGPLRFGMNADEVAKAAPTFKITDKMPGLTPQQREHYTANMQHVWDKKLGKVQCTLTTTLNPDGRLYNMVLATPEGDAKAGKWVFSKMKKPTIKKYGKPDLEATKDKINAWENGAVLLKWVQRQESGTIRSLTMSVNSGRLEIIYVDEGLMPRP